MARGSRLSSVNGGLGRRAGALLAVVAMVSGLLGVVPAAAAQATPAPVASAPRSADTVSARALVVRTMTTLQEVRGLTPVEAAVATSELGGVALSRVWRAFYNLTTADITKITDGLNAFVTWTEDLAAPDYVGPALPMVGEALADTSEAYAISEILNPLSGLGPYNNPIQLLNALNGLAGVSATIDATRVFNGRIDVDNDGDADTDDDGTINTVDIIDGRLDLDGDGTIESNGDDDGTFEGFDVIDGEMDMNGSGTVTAADDGTFGGTDNITLVINRNGSAAVPIDDFAFNAAELSVAAGPTVNLNGSVAATLTVGLSGGEFFIDSTTDSITADYTFSGNFDAAGRIGFVDIDITGATPTLTADFGVDLLNDGDGETSLTELTGNALADLAAATFTGSASLNMPTIKVAGGFLPAVTSSASLTWHDISELEPFEVIKGELDIDRSGTVTAADNGTFAGFDVIGGAIDVNSSGTITAADDGDVVGFPVIDGKFDLDDSGDIDTTGETDSGSVEALSADVSALDTDGLLNFNNLSANTILAGLMWISEWLVATDDFGAFSQSLPLVGGNISDLVSLSNELREQVALFDAFLQSFAFVRVVEVINGDIDVNGDGVVNGSDDLSPSDDTSFIPFEVFDGRLDLDDDGTVETNGDDDGTFAGFEVINGRLDVDRNGAISTSDDAFEDGLALPSASQVVQLLDDAGIDLDLVNGLDIGTEEITYGIDFTKSAFAAPVDVPLSFGFAGIEELDIGVESDTNLELTADATFSLTLGVKIVDDATLAAELGTDPDLVVFSQRLFIDTGTDLVELAASVSGTGLSTTIHAGFLDLELTGDVLVAPSIGLSFVDPETSAPDGKVDFAELLDAIGADFQVIDGQLDTDDVVLIIDGEIDINDDGVITGADDGFLEPFDVINGRLDINDDGAIGGADDGTYQGFDVIDGGLDVDPPGDTGPDGVINGDDDDTIGVALDIINADDDGAIGGHEIIDGAVDINDDGVIDATDDGAVAGYTVIDGLIDVDGDAGIDAADDADELKTLGDILDVAIGGPVDIHLDLANNLLSGPARGIDIVGNLSALDNPFEDPATDIFVFQDTRVISAGATDLGADPIEIDPNTEDALHIGQDLDELLNFQEMSPSDVIGILLQAVEWLEGIAGTDVLATEIPLIDVSIADVVSFAGDFADLVVAINNDNPDDLTAFNDAIADALSDLGLPDAVSVEVTLDDLRIGFDFSSTATKELPFNFSLGDLPLVSADADGEMTVSGGFVFNPTFGISFDSGLAFNERIFVTDDTSALLTASLNADVVAGASFGPIMGSIDGNLAITNGQFGITLDDPTPGDGVITLAELLDSPADKFSLGISGAVTADLEVGIEDIPLPNAAVAVRGNLSALDNPFENPPEDIFNFTTPFADIDTINPATTDQVHVAHNVDFSNFELDLATMVQGVITLADWTGRLLSESDSLNVDLPVVGDALSGLAALGDDIQDIADTMQTLWNTVNENDQEFLAQLEGELNTLLSPFSATVTGGIADEEIVVRVGIGSDVQVTDTFSAGIGGDTFGVTFDTDVLLRAGYNFELGFGISIGEGFFIEGGDVLELFGRATAGDIDAAALILDAVGIAVVDGQLDIKGVEEPGGHTHPNGAPHDDDDATFSVRINGVDHDDDTNTPVRLSVAKFGNKGKKADSPSLVEIGFDIAVDLDLPFETVLPPISIDDVVEAIVGTDPGTGIELDFPVAKATVALDWGLTGFEKPGKPDIFINDIKLDVGAFMTGFAKPVLELTNQVNPFSIDEVQDAFNYEIPVLEQSLRELLDDVISNVPDQRVKAAWFLIKFLLDLDDTIAAIDDGGNFEIEIGSYDVLNKQFTPGGTSMEDQLNGTSNPGGTGLKDKLDKLEAAAKDPSNFSSGFGGLQILSFPLLSDPAGIIGLLTGGDPVDFIQFTPPELKIGLPLPTFKLKLFDLDIGFLAAALEVEFWGNLGAIGRFGLGFDSRGFSGGHEWYDGFYLMDFYRVVDNFENDLIEAGLEASIGGSIDGKFALSAGFDIASVRFKGSADVTAQVGIDLHDESVLLEDEPLLELTGIPLHYRKMHVDEIITVIDYHDNPLCMFRLLATLSAHLSISGKAKLLGITVFNKSWSDTWRILDESLECMATPLAHLEDGTLILHMGPNAGERGGGATDVAENFTVDLAADGETIVVKAFGLEQSFTGVEDIYGDGGLLNDTITIDADITQPAVLLGGPGVDNLTGGGGDDMLNGDGGSVAGAAGADTLNGGAGADVLEGGDLGDTMNGGAGEDVMRGNAGNDTMNGGADADTMNGNDGVDTMNGDAGDDIMAGDGSGDIMSGGPGADTMEGNAGADEISGDAGIDEIRGGDGSDDLFGGTEADTIFGNAGADFIFGDGGTINNRATADVTVTETGADGPDFIEGNSGDDHAYGGGGADRIWGNADVDYIEGNSGNDSLKGDGGNDEIHGNAGSDLIEGKADDDLLFGEAGHDIMFGGIGNDDISGGDDPDDLHGGAGRDLVDGGGGNDIILGDVGSIGVHAEADHADKPTVLSLVTAGNEASEGTINCAAVGAGLGNADCLTGGPGDDYIFGEGGRDFLFGNAGADYLAGNAGTDTMYGDDDDPVTGGDLDDMMFGGADNDYMFGNAGADMMDGEDGNDRMVGGSSTGTESDGADNMTGGPGDDVMAGDNATISGAGLVVLTSTIEGGADVMNGSEDADRMFGQIGGDEMHGGDGADYLEGNGGADSVFGDAGSDAIIGGSSADDGVIDADRTADGVADLGDTQLSGGEDADVIAGDNARIDPTNLSEPIRLFDVATVGNTPDPGTGGGDTINGDDGADQLFGQQGDDTISGDGGSDYVEGNDGDDSIDGGADDDALIGGGSADDGIIVPARTGDGLIDGGETLVTGGPGADVIAGDNARIDPTNGAEPIRLFDVATVGGPAVNPATSGPDTINGNDDADQIFGQAGDDILTGDGGDDYIEGNDGDDTIDGGVGEDDLIGGGSANDGIIVPGRIGDGLVDGGETLITGGDDADTIAGDNARLDDGDATEPIRLFDVETVGNPADAGVGGADTIEGNDGADMIFGQRAGDSLSGDGGDDYIEGNNGDDSILGGGGEDDLIGGGSANDGIIVPGRIGDGLLDVGETLISGGDDADTIAGDNARLDDGDATEPIRLFDVEIVGNPADPGVGGPDVLRGDGGADVIFGQRAADDIEGNDGDDYIEGNNGDDSIFGNAGEDDLIGGGSANDGIIVPGRIGDTLLDVGETLISGGEDADVIAGDNARLDDGDATEPIRLFDVETVGNPADLGVGGPDVLRGDGGDDIIFGQRAGDDIEGNDGDDYIEGNNGDDSIFGNADEDDLIGGGSANDGIIDADRIGDTLLDVGETLISGGAGVDFITGDNARIRRTGADHGLTLGTSRDVVLFDVQAVGGGPVSPETSGGDLIHGDADADVIFGQGNGLQDVDAQRDPADGVDNDRDGREDPSAADIGYDCTDNFDNDDDGAIDEADGDCTDDVDEDASWDGDIIFGDAGDDYIEGNHGSDLMFGGEGEDDMIGGGSADDGVIDADRVGTNLRDGHDIMRGEAEDDVMAGDNARISRVRSGGDWERLSSGAIVSEFGPYDQAVRVTEMSQAPEDDAAYGDDYMTGGEGNDEMYGQLGDDFVRGDLGDDALVGDVGRVTANLMGDGVDDPTLDLLLETNSPRWEAVVNETGSMQWHTELYAFDTSQGGEGGDDTLLGYDGRDTVFAGPGNDIINGDGDGTDEFLDPDFPEFSHITDVAPGSDRDFIFGGDGDDVIWGGRDDDLMYGGYGEDYIDVRPREEWDNGRRGRNRVVIDRDLPEWFAYGFPENFQDVDFMYGGWDRDAMQADQAANGPDPGDRMADWAGAYNVFYVCPAGYGDFTITRSGSPHVQAFLQDYAEARGANDTTTDGTSGFRDVGYVFNNQRGDNSNPPHPDHPGHFICADLGL